MTTILGILVCMLLWTTILPAPLGGEDQPWKRYALIVGANDGGPERTRLRYAVRDAETLRQVLLELGGLDDQGVLYLPDPDGDQFFTALNGLRKKIEEEKSSHSRTEFIFYYSGHSDERHILFARERIPYSAVRSAIDAIATDVRIVILDSCSSGAFTRTKGGKKRAPFMLDKAYDMKGFAFMSSSSSDEVSQESERLKGSFFTHNLVAGLRGAADMNQDGRITLTEAYQYTFDHTLSQTAGTISGPQHPHKTIQMEGTGDVVITDLRRSPYRLVFERDVHGTLLLRTREGQLVVELHKSAGREMEIGLDAGSYQIINIRSNQYYDSRIDLRNSEPRRLNLSHFTRGKPLTTQSRGNSDPAQPPRQAGEAHTFPSFSPFRFSFMDMPSNAQPNDQFLLYLFLAYSNHLKGISIGSGLHAIYGQAEGAQISAIANTVAGDMRYLQMGGLFNTVRGHAQGVQIAGLLNYTRLSGTGLQLGGLLNISGSSRGLQLSGGVNFVEKESSGVQIGLVNVAETVRGAQIGLINIATKSSDFSLGLFSYSPENEVALSFCADDIRFGTVAIKTGNRRSYNIYMSGIDSGFRQNTVGLGWGMHLVSGKRLSLDMDISSRLVFERGTIFGSQNAALSSLRSTLLLHLSSHLRLATGISVNFYNAIEFLKDGHYTADGREISAPEYPVLNNSIFGFRFDPVKANQLWIGVHLGFEYVLRKGK